MQKDDDIEIPSLTLDQDEVSNRRTAVVEPPVKSSPTSKKTSQSAVDINNKPSLLAVYILIAVIMLISAGSVYWLWQQNQQLRDEIYGARSEIENLDHQLIAADISANEQGQSIEETLKTHNSEIRKLWGVAYDRNRKTIAANQSAIEALEKKLSSAESANSSQTKLINSQASLISSQTAAIDKLQAEFNKLVPSVSNLDGVVKSLARVQEDNSKQLQTVTSRVTAETKVNSEQTASLKSIEQDLLAMHEQITTLESATADISVADLVSIQSALTSHQDAIDSNDAFRIQVNAEIIRLRKQINQLMLEQQISAE